MALSTSRVCVPYGERRLCPPKKIVCPYGCSPGFCLNSQCLYHTRPEVMYHRPKFEKDARHARESMQSVLMQQTIMEREAFLASEKKEMGIIEDGQKFPSEEYDSGKTSRISYPLTSFSEPKLERRKTMRGPARLSCMLDVPEIRLPSDDYSQLSFFLRTTTMPSYSHNDTISQARDTYNMSTWNNIKDLDRQIHKVKRDWLSLWGEENTREQRRKKAWLEKILGDSVKK